MFNMSGYLLMILLLLTTEADCTQGLTPFTQTSTTSNDTRQSLPETTHDREITTSHPEMNVQSHRSMPINIPSTATPKPTPALTWRSGKQAKSVAFKDTQAEDHTNTLMYDKESINKMNMSDYGVVITGPSVAVKVGDAVELNCIVKPNGHLPYSFKVTRNLRLIFTSQSVDDIILPTGEKKKGIQFLQHRVTPNYAGLYTCEAHWNGSNRAENDSYRLNITDDGLDIEPWSTDVQVEHTCSISCKVSNIDHTKHDPPVISWYKLSDTDIRLQNDTTSYLLINATTVQHSGKYYCVVLDINGSILRSPISIVKVKTPLIIESVSPDPGTSYDLEDFKANITISGTDRKGPYYLYYIAKSGITSVSRLGLNPIIPLEEEYGTYSFGQEKAILLNILPLTNLYRFCNFYMPVDVNYTLTVVKDPWSENAYSVMNFTVGINDPILLHLFDHDRYAFVGDHNLPVSFQVCIRGNVTFNWMLNGADLPDDVIKDNKGPGLIIPEVQAYHFGLYTLTAINDNNGRKKTRTFRIFNKAPKSEAPRETLDAKDSSAYIAEGNSAYIVAPVIITMVVLLVIGFVFKKYKDRQGVHFNQDHMGMTDDVCNSIGSIESGDLLSGQKTLNPKDKVVYADLDIKTPPDSSNETRIHGAEDRVEYATVDWDKMNTK